MATDRTDRGASTSITVIDLFASRKTRANTPRVYTEQNLRDARADGYREGVDETVSRFLEISPPCKCARLTLVSGGAAS